MEVGNRKLAGLIGGDLVSVDAARILRPPNTWSYKHQPPAQTYLELLEPKQRYSFNELTAHLRDPAPRPAVAIARPQSPAVIRLPRLGTVDAHLRAIATEDYVLALTGRQPNGEHKIACPFPHHENGQEWEASLQLREHGEWNCFGCGTGGTIYDFAAHLWSTSTKGREFKNLRERLAAAFGISGTVNSHRGAHARSDRTALTPAGTGSTVADLTTASLER